MLAIPTSRAALLSGVTLGGLTRQQAIARYGIVAAYPLNADGSDSVGSSSLTLNNSPTFAAGKVGNAIQLASASSQYASITDNAVLSVGNVDFWISCWVQFTTIGADRMLVSKWPSSGNQREYLLHYYSAVTAFRFTTSRDGQITENPVVSTFGAPSTGTPYFVMAYHDSVNHLVGISVNGGAFNTAAGGTGGIFDGTSPFEVGALGATPTGFMNGWIDTVLVGKSPPLGIAALATEIGSWAYNGGAGRAL